MPVGAPTHHGMGCSTNARHTVAPEIAPAKIREDAPFDKVRFVGRGVTTGVGAVINTANAETGSRFEVWLSETRWASFRWSRVSGPSHTATRHPATFASYFHLHCTQNQSVLVTIIFGQAELKMPGQKGRDLALLRVAIRISERSKENGAHPFGSILVGPDGGILLESENTFPADGGPGHAETNLARAAARKYSPRFLENCTLYTSVEPCCMCAGTAYWAGIGAVVFGMTEHRLGVLTGDHPENLTMDLPCRTVFDAGRRKVEVRGPFAELEGEILKVHEGFWD